MTHHLAVEISVTDIQNHWAYESICRMLVNGNANGFPDHTFRPDEKVTALEFLKMLFTTFSIPLKEEGLTMWPDYYIATAKEYHIVMDYDKELTRYEMTELLSKVMDISTVKKAKKQYKDLEKGKEDLVLKLIQLKVINGYEDGTFRGDKELTRAEAVTVILRAKEAYREMQKKQSVEIQKTNSNIGWEDGNFPSNQIRYEIQKHKLFFWDKGRFSQLQNYTIEEKYITNQKLIQMIDTLVSTNTYTAVYYVPSPYSINQVMIKQGETEKQIQQGLDYFSLTYYEDKLYDLNRVALEETFSKECYLKISLTKLWTELYEWQKGNAIDDSVKEQLQKVVTIEFGKNADAILTYMLQQYKQSIRTPGEIVDQVQIGHIIINTYKTDATSLAFYFEKLSS